MLISSKILQERDYVDYVKGIGGFNGVPGMPPIQIISFPYIVFCKQNSKIVDWR